jgi:DNA-binding SARP family transcriptional activator
LQRPRLFRKLDRNSHPITWITGPPGAGKTTLAISWLRTRRIPFLWYHVDEGDSDPASLFYHLGLAARRAAPRKRKPLPILTHEYLTGIQAFSRRFFENVYSRLYDRRANQSSSVGPPADDWHAVVIVFDNYQEVPEDALFHEILEKGLSLVPPGIKILMLSRSDPPTVFVRLLANRLMKTIGWEDLKFTLNESNRMVRLQGHLEASSHTLGELYKKTGGWAAGMVLLLEEAKTYGIESCLSNQGPRGVLQYFAREILRKSDTAITDFLMQTSFLPWVSPEMAEALTGNRQARQILLDLTRRNYFIQRLQFNKDLYQYHPLFREALQFLASGAIDHRGLSGIYKKGAVILEQNGHIDDAFELLRKTEDWQNSVRLILTHAQHLIRQGRGVTLETWIKSLPEAVVQAAPWLLYWMGVCRLPYAPSESRLFFEQAFSSFFEAGQDTVGIFLSLSGLFNSILYSLGTLEPYDRAITLLDEVMNKFPSFPSFEIEIQLTISKLYAIACRQPWRPDLQKTRERLLSILPMITDINMKSQAIHCLIGHYLLSGELKEIGPLIELFRKIAKTHDMSPLFRTVLKVVIAFYYTVTAEFKESRKEVEKGLDIVRATGIRASEPYLLGYGTIGAINSGDMQAADLFLEKMAVSVDEKHFWGRQFYHILRAWKFLIQRDYLNALSHAELSLKFGLDAGVPATVAYSYLLCAVVLHELKRDHEAGDHLAEGYAIARSAGAEMIEFACFLAGAKFSFDKGEDFSGLVFLRKGLMLGRDKGFVSTLFIWLPSMMAELCQRAIEADIEVDYARHLIRKRDLMTDPPPVDCEKWPWAVKVFTLGRFEIEREGDPVEYGQPSGKVRRKPLEMLKALIAAGGGEISAEKIVDWLWPDSRGDAAHSTLKATLSRLRQLIGVERFIVFRDGNISLDHRYCWVDASAFERMFTKLDRTVVPAEVGENVLQLVEKAITLYRGHFLPADEGRFWTISYRERLRGKFLRLISKAGEWLEKAGQWEKAIEHYQKGLDIEELSEVFYQRLMICYRQLGRNANAVEVYRRCRKLLSLKSGIEPSPETNAIYENIASIHSSLKSL